MSTPSLFHKELELLTGCPEQSQKVCDALTKLFGIAHKVDFYDLTDVQQVRFADPDEESDPDNLNAHQSTTIMLYVDPITVPAGLDENQQSVFQIAASGVKALTAAMLEHKERFTSETEMFGSGDGFMMEGRKFLKGVEEPFNRWSLNQCHVTCVRLEEPMSNAQDITPTTVLVVIDLMAILTDKA